MELSEEDEAILEILNERGLTDTRTGIEKWCPHRPTVKQQEFIALDCLEALFGGAAGGGKSDCLLMCALQYVDEPEYAALVLRKSYADLALPGAIMDRSHAWLAGTAANWNGTEKTWTFPSGARLSFGYLDTDKDKYRYQSSEFQTICFDELTQFPESSYTYLISRLRRGGDSRISLRMRSASNPGGVGHDWVHGRFVTGSGDGAFVPSLLSDNPHIDADSYRKGLARLDETTRRQLELGEWIKDSQTLIYKYNESNIVDSLPAGNWSYILGVDFGASMSTPSTSFSVFAFCRDYPEAFLVESTKHAGLTVSDIAYRAKALNIVYKFERMVADQGALGVGYIQELRKRFALPFRPARKQDKLGYIRLMCGELEKGLVKIVRGRTEDWLTEAASAIWDESGEKEHKGFDNHCLDGALYCWREARHYLHEHVETVAAGTPEFYRQEEKRHEQAAVRKLEQSRDFFGNKTRGDFFQ